MDLIYADEKGTELGEIDDYEMDVAFGSDENDFSLTIDINAHCCNAGYYVYFRDTEYGGIIDKIEPDTGSGTVTYEGRTWHGIMEGKIIEPDPGQDYRIVDGNANAVLAELLELLSLENLFEAEVSVSTVEVNNYQFPRYVAAYTGIIGMLFASGGKLQMVRGVEKVKLSVIPLYDYSQDEEWDASQMDVALTKDYHPVNHLICLGVGDLSQRKVIHLFTDENNSIQPFCSKAPICDSDYILDKSHQCFFGTDEVARIFDYGNAQDTKNYILMEQKPSDWERNYFVYHYKDGNDFKQLERTYEDCYVILTETPADWDKNFAQFYMKNGSEYITASGNVTTNYVLLEKEPVDWNNGYAGYYIKDGSSYTHVEASAVYAVLEETPEDWDSRYANYYYYYSDGTKEEYRQVTGETKTDYIKQLMQPSDWATRCTDYYYKDADGYKKVAGTTEVEYTLTEQKPSNWATNYGDYYSKNGDWEKVSGIVDTVYQNQDTMPDDWASTYKDFYIRQGKDYAQLGVIENISYIKQKSKPSDWSKNYGDYYYYYSDGTKKEYKRVSSVSKSRMVLQTMQPSDWKSNYKNYYIRQPVYVYIYEKRTCIQGMWHVSMEYFNTPEPPISTPEQRFIFKRQEVQEVVFENIATAKAPKWEKNTFYTSESYQVAPGWKSGTYYTQTKKTVVPTWESGKYYKKISRTAAPAWENGKYYSRTSELIPPVWEQGKYFTGVSKTVAPAWESGKYFKCQVSATAPAWEQNTFYKEENHVSAPAWESGKYYELHKNEEVIPEWSAGKYYELFIDHYADLVTAGLKRFKELTATDKIDVSLDPEQPYDINDIVGAKEQKTGISVTACITKKIVKVSNGIETIEYKIGE